MELDYAELERAFTAIAGNSVFEVRCLGSRKGQIDSGYFDSPGEAAAALVGSANWYKGIYVTPNPVLPELKARAHNRLKQWADFTTTDRDISRRHWLLIDIDPRRPSGISSSDEEHEIALKRARNLASFLDLYGFPQPMINDSGNGAHVMYRIDEENSDEVRDEIQTFLHIISDMFTDDKCEIDKTVFNAARIWRVPGTWSKKGDSVTERPHRKSQTLQYADFFKVLSFVSILRFNAQFSTYVNLPKQAAKTKGEYPQDEQIYKRLNTYALENLSKWVPHFFPDAREYREGYRIASEDIGESYEEELTVHPLPMGIKYFGVADQGDATEGRRTPVQIISEYSLHVDKATAAKALSVQLNFPISEFDVLPVANHSTPVVMSAANSLVGIAELTGAKRQFDFGAIKSISDLQRQSFKATTWIVDKLLPAGSLMLAARPKMRKTWLALQLAIAVASGREFLGHKCNKCDVLYLALEDNERRIQNRIRTLQKFELDPPDLSGFKYFTGGISVAGNGQVVVTDQEEFDRMEQFFPRGDEGVQALDQYLTEFPKTKVIIIDTLAHFRGDRLSRDIYESDYKAMMPITRLASKHDILIILVTHEKKGNADRGIGSDFLEDVTGSAGMTGGVDGVISIKGRRGAQDQTEARKILISGRDIPFDYEFDVAFDADQGGWINGSKEDAKETILQTLAKYPVLNKQEIGHMLPNVGIARISKALIELKAEGKVEHSRNGYNLKRGYDIN